MDTADTLLLLWAALIFLVLGQICLVQIVIYPLFNHVGEREYVDYHRFYSQRIPLPVILPGFASFLLPLPLALWGPAVPAWMKVVNITAGVAGLLVTILLEIPRHARLERGGKDPAVIAELIRCNWPRTLSISVQAAVTLAMLLRTLGKSGPVG